MSNNMKAFIRYLETRLGVEPNKPLGKKMIVKQ